jgi:hypothetical protein
MAADRRLMPYLVIEARKYAALALDTLVELNTILPRPNINTPLPTK